MKDYLNLMPIAATAKLYGVFRVVVKDQKGCEHITCGYKPGESHYSFQTGKYTCIKKPIKPDKCIFERYARCTTQELSDPNMKDLFAAITIDLVDGPNNNYTDFPNITRMTFLFNMLTEEVKDKWFQRGANESIQPHQGSNGRPLPSAVKNIREIIEGMKRVI